MGIIQKVELKNNLEQVNILIMVKYSLVGQVKL